MDTIAIDIHSHIHYTPPETLVPIRISKIMKEGPYYTAYWDKLSKMEQAAKIGLIFASPFEALADRKDTVQANEDMFQIVQEIPNLYQWVVIDPKNEETFRQADRMLPHEKCVGIKLHPRAHEYELADYAEKVFSFAAKHSAIVLIHPQWTTDYVAFADKYPYITIILAHISGTRHIEAIRNAKHGNIYADTSGMAMLKNTVIECAVSQLGSERILFGTDTYAPGAQRGRIEFAMLSRQDKENIFVNNAKRLFQL